MAYLDKNTGLFLPGNSAGGNSGGNSGGGGGGGGGGDFYKCVSVDPAAKTWSGHKAVWSEEDGYSFGETLTEGLTYGSAFVPNPGGIYNASVTAIVEALYQHTSQRSVLTLSSNNWVSSGTFKQDDGTDYGQRSCVWRSQSDTERLIVWGAPTVDDDRGDSEHAGVEGWHIVMASDTNIHIWWLGDKTYPQSYSNVTVSESFENWTV